MLWMKAMLSIVENIARFIGPIVGPIDNSVLVFTFPI